MDVIPALCRPFATVLVHTLYTPSVIVLRVPLELCCAGIVVFYHRAPCDLISNSKPACALAAFKFSENTSDVLAELILWDPPWISD